MELETLEEAMQDVLNVASDTIEYVTNNRSAIKVDAPTLEKVFNPLLLEIKDFQRTLGVYRNEEVIDLYSKSYKPEERFDGIGEQAMRLTPDTNIYDSVDYLIDELNDIYEELENMLG